MGESEGNFWWLSLSDELSLSDSRAGADPGYRPDFYKKTINFTQVLI